MGDRGRLVVPAALRREAGLSEGSPLVLVPTPGGLLVLGRDRARAVLPDQLRGHDVVAELLAERRAEADVDAPTPS